MSRPKAIDLFSCSGAASVGYVAAGWDVVRAGLQALAAVEVPA